jgi:F420-dependent oxidoreductase-like protein
MRLGLSLPHTGDLMAAGRTLRAYGDAGVEIAFVSEGYGYDAASQIGYFAGVAPGLAYATNTMPLYSRSTGLIAMTAATLDQFTGGRFTLGLGTSGPRVVEQFHGTPFSSPIARTRAVVEGCRRIWRGDYVDFSPGSDGSRPASSEARNRGMRMMTLPARRSIPISIAAMGPQNVRLAAEIADDWAPYFFRPEGSAAVWGEALASGSARRPSRLGAMTITATVPFTVTHDPSGGLSRWRPEFALYLGGMGSASRNFYFDMACRLGYGNEADTVRAHFQAGRRDAAAAAVPYALMRDCSMVGPVGYLKERVAAFSGAGVSTLALRLADLADPEGPGMVAKLRVCL